MSQNHPAAPVSMRARRPGTATAGAVIAIVLSSLGVLICLIGLLVAALAGDDGDPTGRRDAAIVFGVLLPVALVGLGATVMTLRNSNAWRITTVVFGFATAAFWAFAAIGAFVSRDRGAMVGGIVLLVLAAFTVASPVLLMINGANAFYSARTPAAPAYAPSVNTAPVLPPAGWYPVDGSRLRWWDGTDWTDHFHDGHGHVGH